MQENTLKTHFSTVHIFILGKRKKEEEKSVVNEANFFRFRAHSLFFDIVCEVYEKKTELNSKLNATARNTPLLLSLSMLIRVNIQFSKDEIWNSKNWICSRIKRNFELDWVLRAEYIFLWCQESDKMTFFSTPWTFAPAAANKKKLFVLIADDDDICENHCNNDCANKRGKLWHFPMNISVWWVLSISGVNETSGKKSKKP